MFAWNMVKYTNLKCKDELVGKIDLVSYSCHIYTRLNSSLSTKQAGMNKKKSERCQSEPQRKIKRSQFPGSSIMFETLCPLWSSMSIVRSLTFFPFALITCVHPILNCNQWKVTNSSNVFLQRKINWTDWKISFYLVKYIYFNICFPMIWLQ